MTPASTHRALEPTTLVFIHGVGGDIDQENWLRPLSNTMASLGHSRPELSGVDIKVIGYREELLLPTPGQAARVTWKRPADHSTVASQYYERVAHLREALSQHEHAPSPASLDLAPDGAVEAAALLVETMAKKMRADARPYRKSAEVREAVRRRALEQIPREGRLVVVAHSLGSVVALDLIRYLPPKVKVDLLLTIGSPLSIDHWRHVEFTGEDFPYGRLKAWVNVFDSQDPVTAGRGVAARYPEAHDAKIQAGSLARLASNHDKTAYLTHPLVAEAVGRTLYGKPATATDGLLPAPVFNSAWDHHFLAAAYAQQLSITCLSKKRSWKSNFNAARTQSAQQLVRDAAVNRDQLEQDVVGTTPNVASFVDHATDLSQGRWRDDELTPLLVALLMSSPVRPYEFTIHEDHAEKAIKALLTKIRKPTTPVTDKEFAAAITGALPRATKIVTPDGAPVRAYLLIGGATVLAATGVGLWAAAPAGLAGAALISSTMAAFGPGGMVGGMITLAAASGTGSAFVGAAAGWQGAPAAQPTALRGFGSALAQMPATDLRNNVVGTVAVLIAQDTLSFPSTASRVRELLLRAHTDVVNAYNEHSRLGSTTAKDWDERRIILDNALAWLDQLHPDPARELVKKGLDTPYGPLHLDPATLVAPQPCGELLPAVHHPALTSKAHTRPRKQTSTEREVDDPVPPLDDVTCRGDKRDIVDDPRHRQGRTDDEDAGHRKTL